MFGYPLVDAMRLHLMSRTEDLRPYVRRQCPDHFRNFRVELAVMYLAGYSPGFVFKLFREVFPANDIVRGEGRIFGLRDCTHCSVLGSFLEVLKDLRFGDLVGRIGSDWLELLKSWRMGPWSLVAPGWLRELIQVEPLGDGNRISPEGTRRVSGK